MSDQPPKPISWASLAQSNATQEVTKIDKSTSTTDTTPTSTKQEDEEIPDNLSPYVAHIAKDNENYDFEAEWKANPFEGFKQGLSAIFILWEALELILNQSLVDDAVAMSEVLEYDMVQVFITTKGKISPEDLASWIEETFSSNFFTILEDGSPLKIARQVIELYDNCMRKKNFTQLIELLEKAYEHATSGEECEATCFVDSDYDEEDDDYYYDDEDEDYYDEDDEHHHHHDHDHDENGCCGPHPNTCQDDNTTITTTTTTTTKPTTPTTTKSTKSTKSTTESTEAVPELVSTNTTTTTATTTTPPATTTTPSTEQTTTQQEQAPEDDGWTNVGTKPNARPFKLKKPKK